MTDALIADAPLPVASKGRNSTAWLGLLCLIATEGSLFAYLLFSYGYFAVQHTTAWLPDAHPSLSYALPGTVILILSSVAAWWGEEGLKTGERRRHLVGLAGAILLGTGFLVLQLFEWKTKSFSLSSSAYGSFFFTITGFHMAHVIVGLGVLIAVFAWSLAGRFTPRRHLHVTISSAYWHFVDVVWLFVFTTFYVAPYLV